MYEYLLAQYGARCQGCDRIFDDQRYLQLDHNTPRADGGITHNSNRILLCGPCNQLKSNIYTLSGLRRENHKTRVHGENWLRMLDYLRLLISEWLSIIVLLVSVTSLFVSICLVWVAHWLDRKYKRQERKLNFALKFARHITEQKGQEEPCMNLLADLTEMRLVFHKNDELLEELDELRSQYEGGELEKTRC